MKSLAELNEAQRRAATAETEAVMIVAGPGTGKTKTLVARVAWLLESGRARPEEVLAITFTVKAAAQLRERLAALAGPAAEGARVGTFHAVALGCLDEDGREFVSDAERLAVIRGLERPAGLRGLSARELALRISRYKNVGAGDGEGGEDGGAPTHEDAAVARLARTYSAALEERGRRDFDDVLIEMNAWLATGPELPWRYVLVDEFQDTSEVQYEIARRLAARGNLFVIGDPRQSIYGFRGAGAGMFDRLARDYPGHAQVTLEANYRSGAEIVRYANGVFAGQDELAPQRRDGPGRVRVVETLNEYREADWVVEQIEAAVGGTDFARVDSGGEDGGYRFGDVAVVYRTHRAALAVARRLAASGLPYQVAGGDGPYGQPGLRQVVAAMRVLGGEAAEAVAAETGVTAVELGALAAPLRGVEEARPSELAGRLAARLGLEAADDRLAMAQLAGVLVRFDGRPDGLTAAAAYMRDLEVAEFFDPAADAITLLTIHAAKGLEFPVVFVVGAHDGGLPHLRADGANDLDEERRLFYVAVTRAKERLEISYSRERAGQKVAASRFLDGLTVRPVVDPGLADQARKRSQARARRAQGSLF
jgi:superfamily I DNA/RNA helicase